MEDNQRIPFNFTYFAMKLLGKNLYSNPWTAISEIVANGIDAKAKNIYVLIDMRNKEKAIVEIFDDGSGMSYKDLSEKYTLIGRNKRLANDNIEGKTLGRKGIGKLAALYLSPCYYLYTKTQDSKTAWTVDTRSINDSDIPALYTASIDENRLIAIEQWNKLNTGTMIHLSEVDLRKIGVERLKSLPVILADYYLENVIDSNILVSIISNDTDKIVFKKIEKKINFNTLYGLFDNTTSGYKSKIQEKVYLTKETVFHEVDYPRDTVVLDSNKYETKGKVELTNIEGKMSNIEYNMVGWIGIHCSLDESVLSRNVTNFKKTQNHPNSLRLYVRGKLAVDNLMNYVGSSAAFANYIEGEISFDVLDNDMFEDASTSNREGYSISDIRIQTLLKVVGKIITSLIVERNKAGNLINIEIQAIKDRIEREKEAEQKRREEAEKKAAEAVNAQKAAEEKARIEQERNSYIVSVSNVKENNILPAMHSIYNLAVREKEKIDKVETTCELTIKAKSIMQEIGIANQEVLYISKSIAKANYIVENVTSKINLVGFIVKYIEKVVQVIYKKKIEFEILNSFTADYYINAKPLNITMVIENIIGNSIKSNSSKIKIVFQENEDIVLLSFIDNGNGLDDSINEITDIFTFGRTTTNGSGLGLFYAKTYIEKTNGEIKAIKNKDKGLTIQMSWRK